MYIYFFVGLFSLQAYLSFCNNCDNDPALKNLKSLVSKIAFVSSSNEHVSYELLLCAEISTSFDVLTKITKQKDGKPAAPSTLVKSDNMKSVAKSGDFIYIKFLHIAPEGSCVNMSGGLLVHCDITATPYKSPYVVQEFKDHESCLYLLSFHSSLACKAVTSSSSVKTSSSSGWGFFSIVFFLIFISFVLYILIGVGYNRVVHGAKGMEQIPNLEFWLSIYDFAHSKFDRLTNRDNTRNAYDHISTTTSEYPPAATLPTETDDQLLQM